MSATRTFVTVAAAALLLGASLPASAKGAKKKAPPPPPPAELPIAPLVPPPIEEKTIVATPVDATPATRAPEGIVAASTAPTAPRAPLQLAPRVGLYVPRGALGLGPLAGLEVGYTLPISGAHEAIDERLTLVVAGSYVDTGLAEETMVPGRGLDAGFQQRSSLVPVELAARYRLPLPDDLGVEVTAEAGFGLFATWTSFTSFSKTTEQQDLAPGFVGALQAELPIGPGRALLRVSDFEASAELGPLGPAAGVTGEGSFAGLAIALGYVVPLGQ